MTADIQQLTTEMVVKKAIHCLEFTYPMSMIRLGDGEELAMRFTVSINDPEAPVNLPWKKHLGIVPSLEDKEQWFIATVLALSDADIVGLHSNGLNQFTRSAKHIRRMFGTHLSKECNANIHLDLLTSGLYQGIVDATHKGVILVTGHNIAEAFKHEFLSDRPKIPVVHFPVPLQTRYFGKSTTWDTWKTKIGPRVSEFKRLEGWLVLAGVGVPGKWLLGQFKTKGAVVLDIGSVMDMWAGYKTRGKGKGIRVRNCDNALKGIQDETVKPKGAIE